jgi:hypothetical protein
MRCDSPRRHSFIFDLLSTALYNFHSSFSFDITEVQVIPFEIAHTIMTKEKVVTGSCLCRKVRYEATGAPVMNVLCYCENCRKVTGSICMANSFYLKPVSLNTPDRDSSMQHEPKLTMS